MTFKTEDLLFNSEYEFNVNVEYDQEKFAGKLSLNKNAVRLIVSGEQGDGQMKSLPWNHITRVECHNFNSTISLFDLRFMSGATRVLSFNPPKTFFESTYEVGSVLFSKAQFSRHHSFIGINIHSDTVSQWLGNTKKQEEIIGLYYRFRNLSQSTKDQFLEFSCNVQEKGIVGAAYNPEIFHSSPEFKAGITYPPSLFFMFNNEVSAEYALQITTDVIALLKFMTGGNVEISKIEFLSNAGQFSRNATLFFPRHDAVRQKSDYIFFPLGKDLRFDTIGLPEFPTNSIERFFSQDSRQLSFFRRYLKYRDMNTGEEKFLGIFRLLEALAYKEGKYLDENLLLEVTKMAKPYLVRKFADKHSVTSFLKRIPRWNASKYNVEKCIVDLLEGIPKSVSEKWKYGAKDVGTICTLRNDITHANDYEESTTMISGYTKFVEILVVYSLLAQIGVAENSAAAVLHRLSGYHEIMQNDALTTRDAPE